jgi:hypothetical protein
MGLFGPSKIRIAPKDFVRAQLDELFSPEFISAQKEQYLTLSRSNPLLRGVSFDTFIREKQVVVYRIFHLAWCRNIPWTLFMEDRSNIEDDQRLNALDTGAYHTVLSRAQEAGMDTFGFVAMVFMSQMLPQGTDTSCPDFAKLYEVYGTEFTGLYISYEALVKRHKFVT